MYDLNSVVTQCVKKIRKSYIGTVDHAVILGSGLSDLNLGGFECLASISYAELPDFPQSTVTSHKGELSILSNAKTCIAVCAGRQHLYEGYSAQQVATLTYILRELGVKQLYITNAAGALNAKFTPGDVMLISDHINFTGQNPVIGQANHLKNPFPDMSQAYDDNLLALAVEVAQAARLSHHQGVYAGVTGPSLETSAERRMFGMLGADAVGMSTVNEVIAAKHCNMNVLGLSAITNMATGDSNQKVDSIDEILSNAAIAGQSIKLILEKILNR